MGLCKNLNLVLKRSEMNSNDFFDGLFSESRFNRVFSGAKCTKISDFFFTDHFYDTENRFYDKKTDLGRKPGNRWRVRRPGNRGE